MPLHGVTKAAPIRHVHFEIESATQTGVKQFFVDSAHKTPEMEAKEISAAFETAPIEFYAFDNPGAGHLTSNVHQKGATLVDGGVTRPDF